MAIKNYNELYWKLFNIAGGGSEPDVPKVLTELVKSDRAKLDQYFTNTIDQIAFDTEDWSRLRSLFIDIFSSHRSLITQAANISDPHFLGNDELDELFRSFGYPESVRLKNFDNNPLESKVQLFLDLVNLYKIKGTPRSILEVMQYYGIPELDIFEFWLQKEAPDRLTFRGDVIAGTSVNPSPVKLSYDLITATDPHWMMTESQILQLDSANKINLPSKTPYFAVQPVVEIGIENSVLVRLVQDQYDGWEATGDLPPQNAEVTLLGVTVSLLELYLLTLYSFQKDYEIGSDISRFACYDGTNTSLVDIQAEYDAILAEPITRTTREIKWQQYLDLFTRLREEHFLYGTATAESVLNMINPSLIADLESLTANNTAVLQSLLIDLSIWVRNNVGFGFVNLGYIFFGLNQLFQVLKPVINFFKPYRARLIVLELLQFKNQLTESIPIEDSMNFGMDIETFDYMTANSSPCCNEDTDATAYVCIDTTGDTYYSRDTYDCGSYHDIGAVDDHLRTIEINVDQFVCDSLRCPPGCPSSDTTATVAYTNEGICDRLSGIPPAYFDTSSVLIVDPDSTSCLDFISMTCENVPIVFSEEVVNSLERIENLAVGSDYITVVFAEPLSSALYILNVNLFNEIDNSLASMYGIIVTEKTQYGFTVKFSSPLDSINYKLSWNINTNATIIGTDVFVNGQDTHTVNFGYSLPSNDYAISTAMVNELDATPSIYSFVVTDKDVNGFTIQLSSPIDSANYALDWNIFDSTSFIPNGVVNIPEGVDYLTVDIDDQDNDRYSLALSIINTVDATASIYSYLVTQKNPQNFNVRFSGPIDSTNYYLSWSITYRAEEEYLYRQESGFRLFDTMGRFDCSHGFDIVEVSVESVSQQGVIIQENEGWILQEAAIDIGDDDYGILWD